MCIWSVNLVKKYIFIKYMNGIEVKGFGMKQLKNYIGYATMIGYTVVCYLFGVVSYYCIERPINKRIDGKQVDQSYLLSNGV